MASEVELDQNVVLRNLLATIQGNDGGSSGVQTDSVSQLLEAAAEQFGKNSMDISATAAASDPTSSPSDSELPCDQDGLHLGFNPEEAVTYSESVEEREFHEIGLENTVEVPTSIKKKATCIKIPIDFRKKIISMRKEGKKCVDVAKELHVSVSGAQKVWERFLATGNVHDRRPSTYAGRPRKYPRPEGRASSGSMETQSTENNTERIICEVDTSGEFLGSPNASISQSRDSGSLMIPCAGSSDIFVEGSIDVPGATVEVVDSGSMAVTRRQSGAPEYREQLLVKLVDDCPLAALRSIVTTPTDNPHIVNLSLSVNKPLYMEYVLGHPFGKPPSPHPFEGDAEEAQILLSDPSSPVGRDMLAALGYSTKVYFNACCKPSPLFDPSKILSRLPFSIGPGYLAETMQAVLQLLLDLCIDPASAIDCIPTGNGLQLVATDANGEVKSQNFPSPVKLSEYWRQLYSYAAVLECCENFLSACKPSAPCLLCHPFEYLVKSLEIKDEVEPTVPAFHKHLPTNPQQVEVQVLQSGQINFSTESNNIMCVSSEQDQQHSCAGTAMVSGASASNRLPTSSSICVLTSTHLPLSHQRHDQLKHLLDGHTSVSERVIDMCPEVASGCDASTQSRYSDVSTQTQVSLMGHTTLINHPHLYNTAETPPIVAVRENNRAHLSNTAETPPIFAVRENNRAHLSNTAEIPPIVAVRENNRAHLYNTAETPPIVAVRENNRAHLYNTAETPPIVAVREKEMSRPGPPSEPLVGLISRPGPPSEPLVGLMSRPGPPSEPLVGLMSRPGPPSEPLVGLMSRPGPPSEPLVGLMSRPGPPSEPLVGLMSASKLNKSVSRRSARITSQKCHSKDESRISIVWNEGQPSPLLSDLSPLSAKRGRLVDKLPDDLSPECVRRRLDHHPLEWCPEDVSAFVSGICSNYRDIFTEHEIDGESLLTLDPEMMVNCMNIKTGPALKIHKHILDLKRTYNISTF